MVGGRVLVTGATGGLGLILVEALLAAGRDVIATGRDPARGTVQARRGARFIPADLTHEVPAALFDGVGTVFHLAARSSPWGRRADFVTANQAVTLRLLEAARRAGCRRFLFASTPSIYTKAADQLGITEASPLPAQLVNDYARTKLAAEEAVLAASAPGFATASLRPRAVIGPYDTVLLPRLLRAIQTGMMPLPGYGRARIEPTDARDVSAAFLAAEVVAESVSGQAFNISGGQPVALGQLARHAFSRLERQVHMLPLPAPLVLGLAHLVEAGARLRPGAKEPALTAYAAKALGWSQTFDLTAARTKLDWQPQYSPFAAIDWALEARSDA